MGHRITRRELARALQAAAILIDRLQRGGAALSSLALQVRTAHSQCVSEGLVPERFWQTELRELEAESTVVRGGIAHVWRECPCGECAFDRDWTRHVRSRVEGSVTC